MDKYILLTILLILVLTSCNSSSPTIKTNTWSEIVDKEWSGDHGFAGDGFYFYEEEGVATCTYLIYGSGLPIIFHATSEVVIDEEGFINMSLQMTPDVEDSFDIVLEIDEDRIVFDNTLYEVLYERNPLESIDDSKKTIEITTSNNIKIFDGRTGDSFYITRDDYISRIIILVEQLRYEKTVNVLPSAGSSYNIIFEDENKNELSKISMSWPEDLVRINEISYDLNVEDKYLLHAYVGDIMYIMQYDENQRINLDNESLIADINELGKAMEGYVSTEFISGYKAHKWSTKGGFYNYSSEGSPLIYPSVIAPHVSADVKVWLEQNPLVEVIMRTNNDMYLVRIPTLENYVYVSEESLIAPVLIDHPVYEDIDITVNGCKIGDSIDKLKGEISGRTTFGVENGSIMVGFYDEDGESVFDEKGLAFINRFNEIIGIRFSSKDFIIDNKFTIGDKALEIVDYYDNKFGRDESYKNDGYTQEKERYVYIIDDYYLEFHFDDELNDDSVVEYIMIRYKWWE